MPVVKSSCRAATAGADEGAWYFSSGPPGVRNKLSTWLGDNSKSSGRSSGRGNDDDAWTSMGRVGVLGTSGNGGDMLAWCSASGKETTTGGRYGECPDGWTRTVTVSPGHPKETGRGLTWDARERGRERGQEREGESEGTWLGRILRCGSRAREGSRLRARAAAAEKGARTPLPAISLPEKNPGTYPHAPPTPPLGAPTDDHGYLTSVHARRNYDAPGARKGRGQAAEKSSQPRKRRWTSGHFRRTDARWPSQPRRRPEGDPTRSPARAPATAVLTKARNMGPVPCPPASSWAGAPPRTGTTHQKVHGKGW